MKTAPTARPCSERGFTLVELLVVMLIIGLLAAIAAPSFFSQKDKAYDAAAKAAARSAETAIETYATDNDGDYVGATPAALTAIESTLNDAVVTVVSATAKTFELEVASASGNAFTIRRSAGGIVDLVCATAGRAGCPSTGAWD